MAKPSLLLSPDSNQAPKKSKISFDSEEKPPPSRPSQPKADALKRTTKDRITFESESGRASHSSARGSTHSINPPPTLGTFLHYRKKKKTFFYEDLRKKPTWDSYFHLDVGTSCDNYFRGKKVKHKEKKTEIFYHVVDLDDFEYHKVVFHTYLNSMLQSAWFRYSILCLVLTSAVLIGVTTFPGFESSETQLYFKIIDQIILSVFIFEIVVKWMYDFRLFWKVWWNIIDFAVVLVIVFTAVFPLSAFTSGSEGQDDSSKALVIVRVIRAFRSLKSISSLSSLTIVIKTVMKSAKDMGNILLVLIIFMFVMAVMGVIVFDHQKLRTLWFLNALDAWYLLFICVTQDGWNSILDEFRKYDDYFEALAFYLIIAVSIGAFVFANLIVAVIVANLELSVKEQRAEHLLSDDPLDTNSGFLWNELEITSTYELFAKYNIPFLAQRPMNVPTLRHMSLRRLQTYLHLIVALEQNMLEAEIIHLDFEKVMAVILSVVTQLQVYSGTRTEDAKKEGNEVIKNLRRMTLLEQDMRPSEAIDNLEYAAYAHQRGKRHTLDSVLSSGSKRGKK